MLIDNDVKVIFVMGGPGSGKVAQCRRMSEKYGLTFLSTGELLRTDIARGSEGGRRLQRIMSQGEFVSLTDIMNLLKEAIRAKAAGSPGFIIEGFPRDAEQAAKFAAEVAPCHVVIFLDIPEESMMHRLMERNLCVDNEATISTKLRLYKGRTKPVIDSFAKRGLVIKINGLGTEEDVFQRLIRGLTNFTVSRAKRTQSASATFSKVGKLPGKLATKSGAVQHTRNSLLPISSWLHPKHQPEVWKRSDWTYRNGNRLTSKGQNMSAINLNAPKVTVSRVELSHRHEQHQQTASRVGLPARSDKDEQSSRVHQSHRHETHRRTASWVDLLHKHESHSQTTPRVESSHKDHSRRGRTANWVDLLHGHESHPQTKTAMETSSKSRGPKRHRAVMTSMQPTGSPINAAEKR